VGELISFSSKGNEPSFRALFSYLFGCGEKSKEFEIYFDFMDTSLSCESSAWQCKEFLNTSPKAQYDKVLRHFV